jgi:hypothetical protein
MQPTLRRALRASQQHVELYGFIKGFSSLFNPRVPHVKLNPLFNPIPELDASRRWDDHWSIASYVDPNDQPTLMAVVERLKRLGIEGMVCVGGDGTLNGMQALRNICQPFSPEQSTTIWDLIIAMNPTSGFANPRKVNRLPIATFVARLGDVSILIRWLTTLPPDMPRPSTFPRVVCNVYAQRPRVIVESRLLRSWDAIRLSGVRGRLRTA